jgi:hypothetical protein
MPPIAQGRIVWVTIPDPQGGNAKSRPAVVVTSTHEIDSAGERGPGRRHYHTHRSGPVLRDSCPPLQPCRAPADEAQEAMRSRVFLGRRRFFRQRQGQWRTRPIQRPRGDLGEGRTSDMRPSATASAIAWSRSDTGASDDERRSPLHGGNRRPRGAHAGAGVTEGDR